MDDIYKNKYLKYKLKYLKLKGGVPARVPEIVIKNNNLDFFLNFNEKDIIMSRFENFTNLNLVNDKIERVHIGGNGTVNEVIFSKLTGRTKNKINLIMKTPLNPEADNNYYEYVAGLCINNFKKYFPNFAYTFGYGKITDTLKTELEKEPYEDINQTLFKDNYRINNVNQYDALKYSNINEGCELNGSTSILIEKIPNSKELWDYITDPIFTNPTDVSYNLFCVLFQVYVTLQALSDKFTHYDLHTGNVLISEQEKPIIITYKQKSGGDIKLCTKYIPVIIDYGRCYISCLEYDTLINSTNYLNTACNTEKCKRIDTNYNDCELIKGLYIKKFDKDIYDTKNNWFHNVTPHKINNSHDLLLIHKLMERFRAAHVDFKGFYNYYFNNIKCPEWFDSSDELKHGVIEQKFGFMDDKLKNISDCVDVLNIYYTTEHFETKILDESLCLGKMTIYEDMSVPWSFTKF